MVLLRVCRGWVNRTKALGDQDIRLHGLGLAGPGFATSLLRFVSHRAVVGFTVWNRFAYQEDSCTSALLNVLLVLLGRPPFF